MDKKKRMQAQQASIRSMKGRAQVKSAKGKGRSAASKPLKPYKNPLSRSSGRAHGYAVQEENAANPQAEAEESREVNSAGLLGSGSSLFGGIDGIISMMTKANQMFRLFQQMGPMFKLFGMFGGGAKATTASLRMTRKGIQHNKAMNKQLAAAYRAAAKSGKKR